MLLTLEQQIETLHTAALKNGVAVDKDDIRWRDGFVDAGALKLHYLDWGTEGKQPLLMLHGGMQTAHSWDVTALGMKRDCHAVAMDLRGHGDSDWSDEGDYSYTTHSADIGKIAAHLGWEKFVLIGMSLGGLGAMHFASEHSDQLDALVIVDVGPELNPSGVGKIVDFTGGAGEMDSIDDFIERAVKFNTKRTAEQLRYSLTHNLKQLPNGKWTWKYDRRVSPRGAHEVSAAAPTYFQEMWESLKRIACPTLVVRGGDSNVFREETGRKMVDVLPNGRFVTVPDAGHSVAQDNPAGFLEVLRPFLASL
jgi:esterase